MFNLIFENIYWFQTLHVVAAYSIFLLLIMRKNRIYISDWRNVDLIPRGYFSCSQKGVAYIVVPYCNNICTLPERQNKFKTTQLNNFLFCPGVSYKKILSLKTNCDVFSWMLLNSWASNLSDGNWELIKWMGCNSHAATWKQFRGQTSQYV